MPIPVAARLTLALTSCLAWACASAPSNTAAPAAVLPTLEEVFLIPGLHGAAPKLRSLAADGTRGLVDWRPVERDAAGARVWGRDLSPHCISTALAEQTLDATTSLPALLERLERAAPETERLLASHEGWKPARHDALAWSRAGHRLAVAWEGALLLLDWDERGNASRRVLYRDRPASRAQPAEPGEPAAEAGALPADPEWPERLGPVGALEFSEDDGELSVRAGPELFLFPLADPTSWPLQLTDASWPTRALAQPVSRVELSRDRTRAFSREAKLGRVQRSAPDGSASEADAHFLDLASGRGVAFEGWSEALSIEGADLSPCGSFVVAFEVDRTKQPAPTIVPDYLTPRVSTRETRRELADDTWPPRKLWLWSTADGARRALELPGASDYTAQPVGWAPAGPARFALRRTSSDYRTTETWVWDESGPKLTLVERDARWVGGPGGFARWSRDGQRILFASECVASSSTPGRNQLFSLDPASGALEQLTSVEGEVSSFAVNEAGALVISASRTDPARRELGLLSAGALRWLPAPAGMNSSVQLAQRAGLAVFEHEELAVPAELYAVPLDGSAAALRLTRTRQPEYEVRSWILPQKLAVRHPDGSEVRTHVYLPRATGLERPDRPRACVVFIHGAGYLQNVTDSMTEYAVNLMFHSRLAELGYVVADVDYRGSAGYGGRFRTDVQYQLGKLELEDIGTVIDELARRGVVDRERVACYGGSYGGFLTLMALFTQPERWAGGAALRSVTDWRTYHPGYTQPRLGRPSTHAEAYAASSPIDHAQGLKDPLLILHGLLDTNVFAQDSIRLIEKLIDLGLDFDAQLYPSQGHGFEDGQHWLDEYRRIERFLVRCLGAP